MIGNGGLSDWFSLGPLIVPENRMSFAFVTEGFIQKWIKSLSYWVKKKEGLSEKHFCLPCYNICLLYQEKILGNDYCYHFSTPKSSLDAYFDHGLRPMQSWMLAWLWALRASRWETLREALPGSGRQRQTCIRLPWTRIRAEILESSRFPKYAPH